jgi:hypothetical protein
MKKIVRYTLLMITLVSEGINGSEKSQSWGQYLQSKASSFWDSVAEELAVEARIDKFLRESELPAQSSLCLLPPPTIDPLKLTCPWIADERNIAESWPKETVAWLKAHEVPNGLKKQIDAVILNKKVMDILSLAYSESNITFLQYRVEKENASFIASIFAGTESMQYFNKPYIFQLNAIPDYFFKMANPISKVQSEWLNLRRIAYADTLRLAAKRDKMRIIIPQKMVYIAPRIAGIPYKNMPKAIVVAQKIDGIMLTDLSEESRKKVYNDYKNELEWLTKQSFLDPSGRNLMITDTGLALIDTEPRGQGSVEAICDVKGSQIPGLPPIHGAIIQDGADYIRLQPNGIIEHCSKVAAN